MRTLVEAEQEIGFLRREIDYLNDKLRTNGSPIPPEVRCPKCGGTELTIGVPHDCVAPDYFNKPDTNKALFIRSDRSVFYWLVPITDRNKRILELLEIEIGGTTQRRYIWERLEHGIYREVV